MIPVPLSRTIPAQRILKGLLDLAEAAAKRSPVLIAKDIHWADPSTLEFLGLLVQTVRNRPALFIATRRPDGADAWEDEQHVKHVTVLRLDRLPPPELRRLVQNLAGPDRLSPGIVEQIVSRSDGVPLSVGVTVAEGGLDEPDQKFYDTYVCGDDRNYTGYCDTETDRLIDRQSMEADPKKRRKLVWEVERNLAEDASRPVPLYSRFATCMQPRLKGLTTMTNSRFNFNGWNFNGWRMEDVWLD